MVLRYRFNFTLFLKIHQFKTFTFTEPISVSKVKLINASISSFCLIFCPSLIQYIFVLIILGELSSGTTDDSFLQYCEKLLSGLETLSNEECWKNWKCLIRRLSILPPSTSLGHCLFTKCKNIKKQNAKCSCIFKTKQISKKSLVCSHLGLQLQTIWKKGSSFQQNFHRTHWNSKHFEF